MQRSSLSILLSVWKALFLREAVYRLFGTRVAWVWLLMEPIFHVTFFMVIFTTMHMRVIGGIDTAVWLMVGMLGFFLFRRTGQQGMNAISPNRPLFAYRQVKPVDTVLTRAGLEGFLMVLVSVILLLGSGLVGVPVIPADPLAVLEAFVGLWLMGLGFGLVTSIARELVPELGQIINLLMTPLYFLSGVIFPLALIPYPYRDWLLLNPVAHGLEAARLGFAPHYQAVPGLDLGYLYGFALLSICLGLALHVRFANRLAAL